jgi:Histidine kinase-, DNA gyrase B-, and HSP90-like ATPase
MHRTVGDFILDVADNALEAGAKRVELSVRVSEDEISVRITDDGCGMDELLLQRIRDPYVTDGIKHPGRRVGLGIPFLIQAAEICEGAFDIQSEPGKGTIVSFSFPAGHIDTPPVGDLGSALAMLMLKQGDFEAVIERLNGRGSDERSYRITRTELIEALGELESLDSQRLVRRFMASHEEDIE